MKAPHGWNLIPNYMTHVCCRLPDKMSVIKNFHHFLLNVYANVLLLHAMSPCINFTFYLGVDNIWKNNTLHIQFNGLSEFYVGNLTKVNLPISLFSTNECLWDWVSPSRGGPRLPSFPCPPRRLLAVARAPRALNALTFEHLWRLPWTLPLCHWIFKECSGSEQFGDVLNLLLIHLCLKEKLHKIPYYLRTYCLG